MIATSSLLATGLGTVGSLIQARYVSPGDLGFLRKYSVLSGYTIFLSLGLFTILQREYPVLMGRRDVDQARRSVAIVQSWTVAVSGLITAILLILALTDFMAGRWREACAWLVQIVAVWSTLYVGFLACTFRSSEEFERLAKSSFVSSGLGLLVLPLFAYWPFAGLVLRSIAGSLGSAIYLHVVRPVKVGLCLPWHEFVLLVKRGMRLFCGSYLRYGFWPTVEIWLVLRYAGNVGVGLLVFSNMIAVMASQLSTAVNQVFTPKLALTYGQTGSIRACARAALKPTGVSVICSAIPVGLGLLLLPSMLPVLLPNYVPAIPLLKVMLLKAFVVSLSLPLYLIVVLEDYAAQVTAAVAGLAVFVGCTVLLGSRGYRELAVGWGTVVGQVTFVAVNLALLALSLKRRETLGGERAPRVA